ALDALAKALAETRRYMSRRSAGASRSAETEDLLSEVWLKVSGRCMSFDHNLAFLCRIKGRGWANPDVWNHPKVKDLPISLDEMLDRLIDVEFAARRDAGQKPTRAERIKGQDVQTAAILKDILDDISSKAIEETVQRKLGISHGDVKPDDFAKI